MSILLIGCGRMGGALLQGWRAQGSGDVHVYDPGAGSIEGAVRLSALSLAATLPRPLTVIVAVKPAAARQVLGELAPQLRPGDLLVSIMAGISLQSLRDMAGEAPLLVRAMPNIAVSLGRGATAAIADATVTASCRDTSERLLGAVGQLVWLPDEGMLDAATALSGSGPAYFFLFAEYLAQAGAELGLPLNVAHSLATSTLAGAGALAWEDRDLAGLRARVTSPNGTTAAAVESFQTGDRLKMLIVEAARAAARRAGELAG